MAELFDSESPILASYRSPDCWVLLTSERLIFRKNNVQESLAWEQIIDATIPLSAFAKYKTSVKASNADIEVITCIGIIEIMTESGEPMIGFWNVLKMIPQLSMVTGDN